LFTCDLSPGKALEDENVKLKKLLAEPVPYFFVIKSSSKPVAALSRNQNQCLNSRVMTTSVASGSCTSRPDWLSSLQLARFTTTPESPTASTGSRC
jgi:hypothetical protein